MQLITAHFCLTVSRHVLILVLSYASSLKIEILPRRPQVSQKKLIQSSHKTKHGLQRGHFSDRRHSFERRGFPITQDRLRRINLAAGLGAN